MSWPEQCGDFEPTELTGMYALGSGDVLVLQASVQTSDGQFLVDFDGGTVDPRDAEGALAIHEEIVSLIPLVASLMPVSREAA